MTVPSHFFAADVQHLVLMPTEKCNLRCTYCYEDFELPRMPESVVLGVLRWLEAMAPAVRHLTLDWFGGEPLLALEIIERVQGKVEELQRKYPSFTVDAGATTNGVLLTSEVLRDLVDSGVSSYQVSMDGEGPAHDARRPRANGAGSFEALWSNLVAWKASNLDFNIKLRVHVDRDNLATIPSFLRKLGKELAGDPRFCVRLREVSRLGGPNDDSLPVLEGRELLALRHLREVAAEQGLLPPRSGAGSGACYAGAPNSIVVRANGQLAKCTVAFDDPRNQVGWLEESGRMRYEFDRLRLWTTGMNRPEIVDFSCPLRTLGSLARGHKTLPVLQ